MGGHVRVEEGPKR